MEKKLLEISRIIKGKKAQALINNYDNATRYGCRELHDCYKSRSIFKARAYHNIKEECYKYGGYALTIPTFNPRTFTCAYLVKIGGKIWLIYHTHNYRYAIEYK